MRSIYKIVIMWFWSVLFSGCIPAMSIPFSSDPKQKSRHVAHLTALLRDPICITRKVLAVEFPGTNSLRLVTVEMLAKSLVNINGCCNGHVKPLKIEAQPNHPAALMGNVKAVLLRHEQIIAAVSGKASAKCLPYDKSFLNWIGLDHVASLTEIHLQAMFFCINQVHVQAADLIAEPLAFLILINRHRVSRSFAPNFFLAKLRHEIESKKSTMEKLDLSCLQFIASGGEANPVDTCDAVSKSLASYGAPLDVITPGFGMTETCAGAIYNCKCPAYDKQNGLKFACLGSCIPGIKMRNTMPDESHRLARANEQGFLELTGPVVFQEYFNDEKAIMSAFTIDGWFRTGDRAFIVKNGNLNLGGRGKE